MYKFKLNRRIVLFFSVGIFVYFFQLILNIILVDTVDFHPVLAFYISFPFVLCLSYYLHTKLTYSDKISNLKSFFLYALNATLVGLFGGVAHSFLIYLGTNYKISLIFIMLCMAFTSYIVSNYIIFSSKK
jgi:putative flippase GtrA